MITNEKPLSQEAIFLIYENVLSNQVRIICIVPNLNPSLTRNTPPATNKNNATFPLFFTFGSLPISILLIMLKILNKRLFNC